MSSIDRGRPLSDLGYMDLTKLCEILDFSNKWQELSKLMGFPEGDLKKVREAEELKKSPSQALIKMWEIYLHTILELFILLEKLAIYEGMEVIKSYVDPRFWRLIKKQNEEPRVRREPVPNTKLPNSNFDKTTEKAIVKTKGNSLVYSDENNVSHTLVEASKPQNQELRSRSLPAPIEREETPEEKLRKTVAGTLFIPFEQLVTATNNWHSNNVLGQGGFGTVYSGTWQATKVAIKKIKSDVREEQMKELITELHCSMYRHDNILTLYGFSVLENECCCLIYQYMPGGALDRRIKSRDPEKFLSWKTRIKIAIGVARGLQYLHNASYKPLVHGDIKSANILLDSSDEPRIGDFGLVREGPPRNDTHVTLTKVHGTECYLPDDFIRSKRLTVQVDTYCFGVVLFELAMGKHALVCTYSEDNTVQSIYLKYFVPKYPADKIMELKDWRVSGGDEEFVNLINIGKACTSKVRQERPLMMDVLKRLEEIPISVAERLSSVNLN
ncbi:serine/threonine-protein kinase pelle-like [Anthonomus grandis grandis]|uniref:serine/threonine-protein kinase pelle-like n=1 Tax=Anthonomus grandis grandis TaxID=2921223 RepID=UPI00216642BD|nr:serine/threonine-protein kinase pelle-like [Anthonomus grandis grandis]